MSEHLDPMGSYSEMAEDFAAGLTDRERTTRMRAGEEVLGMLQQPHIRDAFSKIEKAYLSRAAELPPHKRYDELRYRYLTAVQVLRQVVLTLETVIRDGKVEKSNIERLDKFKRRDGIW